MIPLEFAFVEPLGRLIARPWAREVTGVAIDSRRVEEGDLFVAVGSGSDFAAHALARGAAAVLVPDDAHAALAAIAGEIRTRARARVVAISRSEARLALARQLGADELVQAGGDDTVERARAACGGDGPEVVVQCVGSAAVDEQAIALATFGGRVVFVGSSPEPFRARAVEL